MSDNHQEKSSIEEDPNAIIDTPGEIQIALGDPDSIYAKSVLEKYSAELSKHLDDRNLLEQILQSKECRRAALEYIQSHFALENAILNLPKEKKDKGEQGYTPPSNR